MAIQIKHACLKHKFATHKRVRKEREREIEKQKPCESGDILGLSVFQQFELHVEYFSKITACDMFSRNPMDSLQNAEVPILKSPPWDPVISL